MSNRTNETSNQERQMIMCNKMIRVMTVAALAVAGLAMQTAAQAVGTFQEWQFAAEANPAPPDVCNLMNSTARARILPGDFSSGWQDQLAGLGSATGFWDLGSGGSVVLPVASGALTGEAGGTPIRVRICQWLDGRIFNTRATVSIEGATRTGGSCSSLEACAMGGWEVDESVWLLPEGQTAGDLTITGAARGTLIDLVAVATGAETSPVSLSIQPSALGNHLVDLSWSAAATGYTLESTGSLNEPVSWETVTGTPLSVGDNLVLTVEANIEAKFFRLRRP